MQENSLPDGRVEARATVRTNLFMTATLHAANVATPIKIRDLSPAGAQIETSLLPDVGSAVTLVRGCLSVHGHVAWCSERRCGLHFSSQISVKDWMTNTVNGEQQRVDHVVAMVKAGAVPIAPAASRNAGHPESVADDLRRVSQLLENLSDALASDPAVIAQHGLVLQNFDIAMQTLTALAEATQSGGPVDAATIVRLDELRASCREALRSGG
jgi:hypothetical protein